MAAPPAPALLLIDVQNDFVTGSLAVPAGAEVIPACNALRARVAWALVALTQDCHPADHVSFAANNGIDGARFPFLDAPGDRARTIRLPDGEEELQVRRRGCAQAGARHGGGFHAARRPLPARSLRPACAGNVARALRAGHARL